MVTMVRKFLYCGATLLGALVCLNVGSCSNSDSESRCESDCGGAAESPEGAAGSSSQEGFSCDQCDSSYESCNEAGDQCDVIAGKCGSHLDCTEGDRLRCGDEHDCQEATNVGAGCDCGDQYDYCLGNSIDVEISRSYDNGYHLKFEGDGGEAVACGRFVNGDYWVAPQPSQTEVVVTQISTTGGIAGADLNPTVESQGVLNSPYGNYDASENIVGSLPSSVSGPASLVMGVQKDEAENGGCETSAILGACIDTYQVVTALAHPLVDSEEFLRPPVYGKGQPVTPLAKLDLERFPHSGLLEGTDSAGLETIRESWSHHLEVFSIGALDGTTYSEGGRAFRADLVTEEYAGNMSQAFHRDLLTLFSADNALDEKVPAISAMFTMGQDLFHALYDCSNCGCELVRGCNSGAGQHMGKLPAMALFAALHTDPLYSDTLGQMRADHEGGRACQEIEQLNVGVHGQGIWGDGPDDVGANLQGSLYRYWGDILGGRCFAGAEGFDCTPSQGQKTSRDYYGYIDGPGIFPGSAYFSVTSGPIRGLAVEMMLFPAMRQAISDDVIINYAARLKSDSEGVGVLSSPDECAPPDPRDFCESNDITDPNKPGCYGLTLDELHPDCNAWNGRENCGYFGDGPNTDPGVTTVTWGTEPDVTDLRDVSGQCVKKGTTWTKSGETWTSAPAQPGAPNHGQPGRFVLEANSEFDVGNPVWVAEAIFDEALEAYRAD